MPTKMQKEQTRQTVTLSPTKFGDGVMAGLNRRARRALASSDKNETPMRKAALAAMKRNADAMIEARKAQDEAVHG